MDIFTKEDLDKYTKDLNDIQFIWLNISEVDKALWKQCELEWIENYKNNKL